MYHPLLVEYDVPVPVRDGSSLAANVFRPDAPGRFPAILTLGPYPKDIHMKDWRPEVWDSVPERGGYMHWETVNPEWWVPQGYTVVRIDARGTGKSPGRPALLGRREAEDFHDAIEWAAQQPWCSGRVAVMGISYFAMNAWRVAALRPPHLAAIVPWEGAVDLYRDVNRHGGIFSDGFTQSWSGHVRRHLRAADEGTGEPGTGEPGSPAPPFPELCSPAHAPDLAAIEVPLLSAGNWGGVGLHLRGNVEGYLGAGSRHKLLEIHQGDHVTPFYSLEGRLLQKRFLDQWLKGIDTGITREPPIKLAVRRDRERYAWRYEYEWPLARTRWTEYYLDARRDGLATRPPDRHASIAFSAEPDAATTHVAFTTPAFADETEVTGPIAARLWISCTHDDADLFAVIRNFGPDGREVTFQGQSPAQVDTAVAYGWLRASHRKLDAERSTPYRPLHSHDEIQKLKPAEVVPVEIEIWPTSAVFEPGHRLVLELRSHDDPNLIAFQHRHPGDRVRSGEITVHTGGPHASNLLLPVIPGESELTRG